MKTIVPKVHILLCVFFLVSFTAKSESLNVLPTVIDLPNGEYNGCFVQYTDGTVKQFGTLKLVTGIFKTPHLVADDSVVIYAAELKAYQNENGYAVSQKGFAGDKKTFVAKDVLPGFAVRIVKGHLNIFSVKYYNGQNITERLFVQHGDGEITACTHELMEELVKESSDAVAVLHSKNKTLSAAKKILAAAEVFNSTKLIANN